MLRSLLSRLFVAALLVSFFLAASTRAQERRLNLLRIGSPVDGETYASGSDCTVSGALTLDPKTNKEDIFLRVRIYRPDKGRFVIVQDEAAKIEGGPDLYTFHAQLKTLRGEGKHLLKVDWLDWRPGKKGALVASQALFLNIQPRSDLKANGGVPRN